MSVLQLLLHLGKPYSNVSSESPYSKYYPISVDGYGPGVLLLNRRCQVNWDRPVSMQPAAAQLCHQGRTCVKVFRVHSLGLVIEAVDEAKVHQIYLKGSTK